MAADSIKKRRSLDVHLCAILLLPLLVLWRRDDMLFTPIGWTDPWFYVGFGKNLLEFKRYLFRNTYYGSRLAWILPSAGVHSLLSPVAASYVLHLGVWAVATFSFFLALRWMVGVRAAFLATVLWGTHPWLWAATGWDYPDGSAVAYFCLATALFTYAALQPPRKLILFLAGLAVAAAIHSNLSWIVLAPPAALTYIGMAYAWRWRPLRRSALDALLWSGSGAVLLTVMLGVLNQWMDGNFWFFVPSIRQGRWLTSQAIHWTAGVWSDRGLQPALWFPAAALLVVLVLLPLRLRRAGKPDSIAGLVASLQLVIAVAVLSYYQRSEVHGLSYRYYTSALAPFSFLAVGTAFWKTADRLDTRGYVMISAAAMVLSAILCSGGSIVIPEWARPAAVIAAVIVLAAALFGRGDLMPAALPFAGFFLLSAMSTIPAGPSPGEARLKFQRIMDERQRLESARRGRRIRFWFDEKDPEDVNYTSLMSTYLVNWSYFSPAFPQMTCEPRTAPETGVVVLSTRPDAGDLAQRMLSDCWKQSGLQARRVLHDMVPGANQPYTVTALFAESDPDEWHPMTATFDHAGPARLLAMPPSAPHPAIPLDGWSVLRNSSARRTPAGLDVRTSRDPYYFALASPALAAPSSALYRFTIRYVPRAGNFAFGPVTLDNRWMAEEASGGNRQLGDEVSVSLRLQEGQVFRMVIANNDNDGLGAAALLVREVTAAVYSGPPTENHQQSDHSR